MIFNKGYSELDRSASKSLISTDDDLYSPGWGEQLGAFFDKAYYRYGSGVMNTVSSEFVERNRKLAELMREKGFSEEDITKINFNRPDIIPESMTPEEYAYSNSEYDPNLNQSVMAMFEGQIESDDQIIARAKQIAKGELENADSIAARGDSLSAAIIGTMGGAFTDPMVIATSLMPMFNTVTLPKSMITIGNSLKSMGKTGAAAAGGEVLSVPIQAQNAAFLGEDYGVWDAAQNIALAGAGGSILSAVALSGRKAVDFVDDLARGVKDAPIKDLEAEDAAHTLLRAKEDGLIKNAEDIEQTLKDQESTLVDVADWRKDLQPFDEGSELQRMLNPEAQAGEEVSRTISNTGIYDDLLTAEDAIMDAQLFKQASELDTVLEVGVKSTESGEQILKPYKQIAKELDDELAGYDAVALCMRGGA